MNVERTGTDNRSDGLERVGRGPEIGRVQARMQGRSLPVPPLIPSVAVIGLLFGLVVGFSLGSVAQSLAAPGPTLVPVATPTLQLLEVAPPTGGLTLAKALAAFEAVGYDPELGSISLRVVPGYQMEPEAPLAPAWVWVLTRQVTCTPFGKAAGAGPDATLVSTITTWPCLEADVIDYSTGDFLSANLSVTGW